MSNLISISGRSQSGKDTIAKMIQGLDVLEKNGLDSPSLDYINRFHKNSNWKIKKFSHKVKQIASILLNVPVEKFEDQEYKKETLGEQWWYYDAWKGGDMTGDFKETRIAYPDDNNKLAHWEDYELVKPTVRQLLQEIGTEAMRDSIHPNAWINALFADYKPVYWRDEPDTKYYPNWIITDMRFPNEVKAVKDRGGILIRVNRTYSEPFHNMTGTDATTWVAPSNHSSETALDSYKDWDFIINNDGDLNELLTKVKEVYEEL